MEVIRNDQEWLDLNVGEEAIIAGTLTSVTDDGLVITFTDWSQLAIDREGHVEWNHLLNRQVSLVATRTEDGMKTL